MPEGYPPDGPTLGPLSRGPVSGYQPREPLTGGPPPKESVSGVRARPEPPEPVLMDRLGACCASVLLPTRALRALELLALARWTDVPAARKIARGLLDAWEGEACGDESRGR